MTRLRSLIARMPIRVRVAVAFTGVMAVLLGATGVFLYVHLGSALNAGLDTGLRARATYLTALVEQADLRLTNARGSPLTQASENFAQIIDPSGRVIAASPGLRGRAILTPDELRRATRHTVLVDHAYSPLRGQGAGGVRLLGIPVSTPRRQLIVVVGASLQISEEAQRDLGNLLLVGFPIALLLALVAGYGAAACALRPVELMRRRAREIQASQPGRRLPVPAARDEVGRLGETLNEMLERLEVAFARERAFAADASHELRMPLAVMKSELELALRDGRDVEAFRAAVSSASEETDRLVQLAEDLLVIARLDQGGVPLRCEDVDVLEVLEDVRRRFAQRAHEQGAVVEVDAPAELVARIDGMQMKQALGNLLDNALRHGGSRIQLVAWCAGAHLELHVHDDGSGFDERFIARAFERFTRADAARGRGGAGLGLAIARAIAVSHGGRARAANRPAGGADVWLELPAEGGC